MLNYKDFEGPDGKIDWSALRRAEVASGERCKQCDTFIWPASPATQLCHDCRDFEANDGAVWHDHAIRCPNCGNVEHASERGECGVYADGTHELYCYECEQDFEIETAVSYSFKSPPRKK